MNKTRCLAAASAGALILTSAALATYDDPQVLTVEQADNTVAAAYHIDEMSDAFEIQEITTRTPWTDQGQTITFRGPYVKDVLAAHGLDEHPSVRFIGYDDFVSEIQLEEIQSFNPIFAIERQCTDEDRDNGNCTADQDYRPITSKESGPIFIVWPFDSLPTSYVPARNSIWVWFVVAVRPVT